MGGGDVQTRQLRLMRVQTAILLAIFLLLLAAGVFLAVQFSGLQGTIRQLEEQLAALDLAETAEALTAAAETMGAVDATLLNEAVASLEEAAENLSAVDMHKLNGAIGKLQGAADNLSAVDMKQLNDAVAKLKGAAENLQDVDVESLNSLVSALETVATKLEGTVNTLSNLGNLFKRD